MKKNTLYTILLTFVLGWGATSMVVFRTIEQPKAIRNIRV